MIRRIIASSVVSLSTSCQGVNTTLKGLSGIWLKVRILMNFILLACKSRIGDTALVSHWELLIENSRGYHSFADLGILQLKETWTPAEGGWRLKSWCLDHFAHHPACVLMHQLHNWCHLNPTSIQVKSFLAGFILVEWLEPFRRFAALRRKSRLFVIFRFLASKCWNSSSEILLRNSI